MIERWAAGGDIGPAVLDRVQGSLKVGMIMTARDDLMTCRRDDSAAVAMARNVDQFSFIPVVDDNGRYLGLFRAEAWFGRDAPDAPIGDDFEAFSEDLVIGADASIFDFVMTADARPTRLVVSGHQVAGLISLSDLQQLPVRAALFTLLTSLEIAMAQRIEAEWTSGSADWMSKISAARQVPIRKAIARAKDGDGYVNDIVFTQLCDKVTIILKGRLVKGSPPKLRKAFKGIEKLRNDVAHANYYAETPETAREVCVVVREIFKIKADLIEGINEKIPQRDAGQEA
jgi:CBS domain-containing protein